ncbi:MAG: Ser-Thr-rich GPI-anchored membrane family protein, partial [Candidatus Omnitrophica bacterium]|nr:Ser-Thr-rich GPI-anchored membrane family protein [Candidatus Omnitrophota bacterium]
MNKTRRVLKDLVLFGFSFLFLCFIPYAEAAQIKRVQQGIANFDTDDTVQTATLGYAVDQSKSIILVKPTASVVSSNDQNWFFTGQFESNSVVAIDRAGGNAPASVLWQVIEFTDGVRVQRGISSMVSPSTLPQTKDIVLNITPIDTTKAVPIIQTRAAFTNRTQTEQFFLLPTFPDANTLRLERLDATGTKATQITWQVIEFLTDATVQTGTTTIAQTAGEANPVDVTVSAVTNPILFTYFTGDTTIDGQDVMLYTTGEVFNSTTLRFYRYYTDSTAGKTVKVVYYVVDLINPSNLVQSGTHNWTDVGTTVNINDATNASPIVITTATNHGYSTGDLVNIQGVPGNLAANGNWIITVTGATTFSLNGSSGSGIYSAGTDYAQKAVTSALTSIDTTRTMALSTTRSQSGTTANNLADDLSIAPYIFNATTLATTRSATSTAASSRTQISAIEFCPLTLNTPNGAEVWKVGQTQNITWKHADSVASDTVKLKLCTTGSATLSNYTLTIAAGLSASADSYAWTIPDSISGTNLISTQLRVAIIDTTISADETGAARNYDTSNANFEIKGTITVTAPNGGEIWNVGDTSRNITWNKTGDLSLSSNTFSIDLSQNGGSTYPTSIASGLTQATYCSGNSCSYIWNPVGDYIGNDRRVRVSWTGDPALVKDESNANFYIKGKLAITAPNGAEVWATQSSQGITWNKWGTFSTISLYYSTNSGGSYPNTIATVQPAGAATGSYAWLVPVAGISDFVRVKIVSDQAADLQVESASTADFKIIPSVLVTSPNAGTEVWRVGESQNITWTVGGGIANVKIEYSTDGGSTYPPGNVISASTPGASGSYPWTIPDMIGDTVKVKISDVLMPATFDESDNNFKIKGKIVVGTPDGGEVYPVASSQIITWQKYGTLGNVDIKYSTDGGATFPNTIAAGISASALNYTWNPIPDNISSTAKVRVELISDPSNVFGVSTANFAIKGSLILTAPTGGESFSAGGSTTITWTKQGTIGNVQLIYSTDGGTTYPPANTIVSGLDPVAGTPYTWIIPDAIGNQVRVKVCLVSDSAVYSTSTSNFSIKGSLSITSPSGAEKWGVGTSQPITWTRNGASLGNVKLDYSSNGGLDGYPYVITASVDSGAFTYPWTIPDAIGNQVKIKITSLIDASINAVSTGTFSIIGRFALNAPSGGETWYVGTSQNISWTTYGTVDKVNLYYSTNGGALYSSTIVSAATNVNAWSWTIPDALGTQTRVKVESFYDNTVYAVSAADFTIKGRVVLTSPNGGEAWIVGATQNITWTAYGSIGNVDIYYSTDGGATYPPGNKITPLGGIVATLGTYAWTIPDAIGSNLKIKIISVSDSTIAGESAAVFTIRGSLLVTAPNGGESFYVGDSTNIIWTKTGTLGNVELRYSIDGGLTYPVGNVIATGVLSTATPYAWTIPDAIATQLRVKILLLSDASNVFDESNANFTIKGKLLLAIPNGAESWEVGTAQNITWSRVGSIANAELRYSTDGGTTYPNIIIASTPAVTGSYAWTIPDAIGTALKVKIIDVSDATVFSASSANFAIKGRLVVTYPNGGETLIVGTAYDVLWSTAGTISKVNLYYSTDGGTSYTSTIATAVTNTNSYSWTIPDAIGTQVKVKVANFDDAAVFDTSNADFTVKGSIVLTAPNGAEVWRVGTQQAVTWTKTGSLGNAEIKYSTDGGASYPNVITVGVPSSDLQFLWTIPDNASSNLKVKITSLTHTDVFDESNAVFSIKPSVSLTAPNGGEVLTVGTSQNITWAKTGTISTVKLEYSTNGFSDELQTVVIAALVNASTGTPYAWTVPDAISSTVKVRVVSEADPLVYSISATNFKIIGSFILTAPNGAEQWTVGQSYSITWTKTGSITNAKIEY